MADRTDLLAASEAAALLTPGLAADTLGVPFGRPVVAVALGDDDATHATAMAVPGTPAVVIGVVDGVAPPAHLLDHFDVVVARADLRPPGGVPRSVVLADDPMAEVDVLVAGVAASPAAAVALVQLLRAGVHLSVAEAVVAESWVYSMLQAGPDHDDWLSSRRSRGDLEEEVPVRVGRSGPRLDVHLDRPGRRNAVSAGLRDALHEALAVALADPTVGEVHLWGRGPSFCAGGDLEEFGSAPDPVTAHLVRTSRSPALDLARCSERLVVHVQGAAVGAGCEWAAFARRVVAREDATFRLPEVSMGLVPGAGGTASLPRRIGRQRTALLALTGQPIGAETALEWELVDAVVDGEEFVAAQSDALRWTDTA